MWKDSVNVNQWYKTSFQNDGPGALATSRLAFPTMSLTHNLRCRYSWVLQASHITTYIRWCYIISQQRWIPTTVPMSNRLKKQLQRLNPFTSLLLLKGFVSINSKSISQWYMSVITTTKKGYISHRIVKRRAWWSPFKICPGKNNSITKHLSMISNNSTHLEFDLFKITLPLGIVWEV